MEYDNITQQADGYTKSECILAVVDSILKMKIEEMEKAIGDFDDEIMKHRLMEVAEILKM